MTNRKTSEQRRREIADAAIKIIGDRGLREFTAAHLGAEVGIRDGTIFRHFKDMNEIAQAVLGRLQELLEASPPPAGDPLARLREFLMKRLLAIAVQPGILSLLFSDQLSHALGADGPRRVAALRNQGRLFVKSCLLEAREKGLIRQDIDLEATVLLVTGMVMSFLFASKDGALSTGLEEMAERSWQVLLSMLARREVSS